MFIEKVREGLWKILWSSAGYVGPQYFTTRRDAENFGATLLQMGGNVDKATDRYHLVFARRANVAVKINDKMVYRTVIVFEKKQF